MIDHHSSRKRLGFERYTKLPAKSPSRHPPRRYRLPPCPFHRFQPDFSVQVSVKFPRTQRSARRCDNGQPVRRFPRSLPFANGRCETPRPPRRPFLAGSTEGSLEATTGRRSITLVGQLVDDTLRGNAPFVLRGCAESWPPTLGPQHLGPTTTVGSSRSPLTGSFRHPLRLIPC